MYIRYATESSRRWSITPDEEAFLAALEVALRRGAQKYGLDYQPHGQWCALREQLQSVLGENQIAGAQDLDAVHDPQ